MTEVRRARIQCDIGLLVDMRERLSRIRDDESKAVRGESLYGDGNQGSLDLLSEAMLNLLAVIGKLDKAKACN